MERKLMKHSAQVGLSFAHVKSIQFRQDIKKLATNPFSTNTTLKQPQASSKNQFAIPVAEIF